VGRAARRGRQGARAGAGQPVREGRAQVGRYGLNATFYEYNELALQYGYLVLFTAAFPAGVLLALLNNLLEIRSDSFKMLKVARRAAAMPCKSGIGAWKVVLSSLSYAGLATNLLILGYTADFFSAFGIESDFQRFAIIIAAEHLLLAIKLLVDWSMNDVPTKVKRKLAREAWLAQATVEAAHEAESKP